MAFLPILGAQEVAVSNTLTYAGVIPIVTTLAGTYSLTDGSLIAGTVTETWTVADALATLDGDHDWDDYLGFHQWNVVSGTASLEGTGGATMQGGRLAVDRGTSDYQVSLTLAEWLDTGTGLMWVAPLARMQGDTSITFYAFDLITVTGVPYFLLYRFVAGAQTQLGAQVPATGPLAPAPGMVLTLRVQGSQIQGYVNGTLVTSVTDTAIPTGRFAGLQGGASTGNRVRVDDLAGAVSAVYLGTIPLTLGIAAAYAYVPGGGPVIPPSPTGSPGGQLMITQGTSFERKVRMLDSAGLAVLGATLTITLAKGSGAFTLITPTVAEQGDGWYNITFTTAHNDTLGSHTAYVTAAGAVARELYDQVVVDDPSAGEVADAVWDEPLAGHAAVGSTAAALSASGASGDPWITPLPGPYPAGTAGKIIGDRIAASVEGAVGSVTGNVTGNVQGTVSAVTGNVGGDVQGNVDGTVASVTGNVDGNVTGSVGSVVGGAGDKTGYRLSAEGVDDILRTALPEAYAADGAAATLTELLYLIQQFLSERTLAGTTLTIKKLDGAATAAVYTTNSAGNPTSYTRSS